MPAGVTIKKTFDFRLMAKRTPQLMANGQNDVVDILRDDMKQGAARGEGIDGRKWDSLQPATITAKRRGGSATSKKPLIDKNVMIGVGSERGRTGIFVSKRSKPKSLRAIISIPRSRQVPGVAHNEGLGNQKRRRWFYVLSVDSLKRPAPKLNKVFRRTTVQIANSAHV